MALKDFTSAETIARSKRGQISRNLGGKPVAPTKLANPRPSNIEVFSDKLEDVTRQTGSVLAGGVKAAGSFVVNTAKDIGKAAGTVAALPVYIASQPFVQKRINEDLDVIARLRQGANQLYQGGVITKQEHDRRLQVVKDSQDYVNKLQTSKLIDPMGIGNRSGGDLSMDVIETGFNILTMGAGTTAKALAKEGGKQYVKSAGWRGALEVVENQIARVPAVRQLVTRNAAKLAGREAQILAGETAAQFIGRESKRVAFGLLIKRPIFYQTNLGDAKTIYRGILDDGDGGSALMSAAFIASQALEGGPLGLFFKGAKWTKGKLAMMAYGRGSFIDEVSRQSGADIAGDLLRLSRESPEAAKESEKLWRIFAHINQTVHKGDAARAAASFLSSYNLDDFVGKSPTEIREAIEKIARNHRAVDELWNAAAKSGKLKMPVEEAARYTPVRWDVSTRNQAARVVAGADDKNLWETFQEYAAQTGIENNNSLMLQAEKAIKEAPDAATAAKAIQAIDAAATAPSRIPKSIANQAAKLGYIIAEPKGGRVVPFTELNDTKKLVSAAVDGGNELFDETIEANAFVQTIARGLQKAGLSPEASTQAATRALSQSVAANLDNTSVAASLGLSKAGGDSASGGQAILSKLQNYVENKEALPVLGRISSGKSALIDIRQLRVANIQEALGSYEGKVFKKLDAKQAREVMKAVTKGYMEVPLELRGLGDRVVDGLYRINPLQKHYARIQSAFRYTYNPFFKGIQEPVETALLARTQATNPIWNQPRATLNNAVDMFEDMGLLGGKVGSNLTTGLAGEAAQDVVIGRISANITRVQKRNLAGLGIDLAKSKGYITNDMDEVQKLAGLKRYAQDFPQELEDALMITVQYPRKGLLASPLARTLNVAFFPIRYNTKVTMMAAKVLAKQPPSVQTAVIHSALNMREYLKSDEGIQWQSDHADAIQLFKWMTPFGSIESAFKILTGPESWGDMGLMGGLPLGLITQVLDGQGIIDLNTPYVNPKTGDVFPEYIPQTTKARAAVALTDLLNTMFTYPGRLLGLPGKETATRTLVKQFIETEGKDFEKRLDMDKLTPLQQNWVRVLKGDESEEALDALYTSPAEGQFNWYTLPPLNLPIKPTTEPFQPLERRTAPSKASKGKKAKKKALAMPQR